MNNELENLVANKSLAYLNATQNRDKAYTGVIIINDKNPDKLFSFYPRENKYEYYTPLGKEEAINRLVNQINDFSNTSSFVQLIDLKISNENISIAFFKRKGRQKFNYNK